MPNINIESLLNKTITCDYAGKARKGKVVKVESSTIRIEYIDAGKVNYRSLSRSGIANIIVVG